MCLVALLYHVSADAPVVVAANREEDFARGGLPPHRFPGTETVGGSDPVHGGTWLGINAHGVLVAVTNRRKSTLPSAPRSRGLLVRDLLGRSSAAEAAWSAARELESGRYAGCNLLCVDAKDAVVIHAGDWLRVRPLPAGIHVLANRDVDDDADRRVAHAANWLCARTLRRAAEAVADLRLMCASHEPPAAPICFRDRQHGTVSSSLVALAWEPRETLYLHAQGPPDVTPYDDYSDLLRGLTGTRSE